MKRNTSIFLMIVSVMFSATGAVILLVLTADGALQLEGVALGAGFGFWLALGFLAGRAIYGDNKNVVGLIVFMLLALAVGLVYHFQWQLPYINSHPAPAGLMELLCGMVWALSFAAVYLSYQDYRRSEN
ncbi:MAG: hypothetical protein FJW35_04050 [Acidobacteria bacterium]|nr:hypothetical protein [Acidobacteriota bacterium]